VTRLQFYGISAAAGLALILIMKWANQDSGAGVVEAPVESTATAEKRLDDLRRIAATVPGKEEIYKKAAADLALREKTLLKADTIEQAKVALLQRVQDVARANQIDARGNQDFRQKVINSDYGEVTTTVVFSCGIEQLVNLLTAIGNQPEALATDEIHVSGGSDKKKNIQVRMSVGAAVPRKLLPEKKGPAGL
jgi:hypothetical protein